MAADPLASDDIAARLAAFIAAQVPAAADIAISGLSRSGAGTSRENWPFDATWIEHGETVHRKLILRRDPPRSVVDTEREREVALLRVLERTAIPTPRLLWADLSGQWLDRPFIIMERCRGVADRGILTERDPFGLGADRRAALARDYCDALADIHALDVATLGLPDGFDKGGANPAAAELAHWDHEVRRFEIEPQPALRLVSWWLHDNLPAPPGRKVLVHGDFRPANALVEDGKIQVVLDWEFAHVGDPVEDLGWYCTPFYRHEHFVKGTWGKEDFLRRYEASTGAQIDRAALHFWEVLAIYKNTSMLLAGLAAFRDGEMDGVFGPPDGLTAMLMRAIERP